MAMAVRFGTDGIRGRYPEEVHEDLAYRLGRAVAQVFPRPVFLGYDTRESSPLLAAALYEGLVDGGAVGINLGLFTTPGVAVTAKARGGVGVVVSASHNLYQDNGLKVLGPGGGKLDHATEAALEIALREAPSPPSGDFHLGPLDELAETAYVAHLLGAAAARLDGLRVIIDCANGSASHVAQRLFSQTGAHFTLLNSQPNGHNIKDHCGSTSPEQLRQAVLAEGADLGLALDGDADRLIAVDAQGTVRDGDDLMALFSQDLQRNGRLGAGVALTIMSNLGLRKALSDLKIEVVETDVGDRHVAAALEEHEWHFGGEQSGHLLFRDLAPSGDGLLTGLLLLALVARHGPLATQCDALWHRIPQELANFPVMSFDEGAARDRFSRLCAQYGYREQDVRLVIRPSGTEPVIRVMVEAPDASFIEEFLLTLQ